MSTTLYTAAAKGNLASYYRGAFTINTSTSNTGVTISFANVNGSVVQPTVQQSRNGTSDWSTASGVSGHTSTSYCSIGGTTSTSRTITRTKSTQSITVKVNSVDFTDFRGRVRGSGGTVTVTVPAKPSYTVSYNANGGSGAPSNQTKWYGETLTLSSTKPTRTGYTFKGWNTNSSGTGTNYSSGGSYTGNAALTLYAKWQINTYSVTYNANGGSGAPGSQTKTYGTNLTLSSTKPTMVGYTFKGWATSLANAQAGTVNYESGGTYTGNAALTLYAVWELTYAKPKIENVIIERCTSTGTPDDEGSYAKVSFGWSVYRSDNPRYYGGSTSSLPYQSNAVDSCTVVVGSLSETLTLTGASGTETVIIGNGGYNVDTAYTTTITITDTQTIVSDHTTTYIGSLATTFFPMDYNPNASAVGFFRPAPDNGDGMYLAKNLNIQEDIYFELDTNAASGTDHDLIAAITALGWTDLLM